MGERAVTGGVSVIKPTIKERGDGRVGQSRGEEDGKLKVLRWRRDAMDKRLLTAYSNRLEPIAICSHATTRRKYQAIICGGRTALRATVFTPSPLPPPFLPLFHSSANRGGNEEGGRGRGADHLHFFACLVGVRAWE